MIRELYEALSSLGHEINALVEQRKIEFEWHKSHANLATKQDLEEMLKRMLKKMNELESKVSANKDVIASAVILLKGLKALLDAAGTDPAKLADLSAKLGASTNDLASAVAESTPVEPPVA